MIRKNFDEYIKTRLSKRKIAKIEKQAKLEKEYLIANAYEKKTDKMSPQEYNKAQKMRSDYITRCKEEIYYENTNI